MANIADYLRWRGDLSLEASPFNEVDGLILALLSGVNWRGATPSELGAAAEKADAGNSPERAELLRLLAKSPRFAPMRLENFEERFSRPEEMQFAALTLLTGDGRAFVAFRGTDSTLTGWKENLNLAFLPQVPAQREAVRYLARAARTGLPLRTAGHSKGGNLAVYAAATSDPSVQERIEGVYNYDGPGFGAELLKSEGWRAVEARTGTWVPQDTLVGILLEQPEKLFVVKSDARGIRQHDPFTWRVEGDGFEAAEGIGAGSLFADRTTDRWLASMSPRQRRSLVETLYGLAQSTGAQTVEELAENWRSSGPAVLGAFAGLDLRSRLDLYLSVGKLLRSAAQSLD